MGSLSGMVVGQENYLFAEQEFEIVEKFEFVDEAVGLGDLLAFCSRACPMM